MPNDYGYFGKGSTGYAHYQQTFNRCFGSGSGGGGHRPPNNNNNNNGGGGDNGGCLTYTMLPEMDYNLDDYDLTNSEKEFVCLPSAGVTVTKYLRANFTIDAVLIFPFSRVESCRRF